MRQLLERTRTIMDDCLPPSIIIDGRDRIRQMHGDIELVTAGRRTPSRTLTAALRPELRERVVAAVAGVREAGEAAVLRGVECCDARGPFVLDILVRPFPVGPFERCSPELLILFRPRRRPALLSCA